MDEIFDVVQVGYGPVGQVLAAGLGRCGHRVQVIERHDSLYGVARAGRLDHEVMRVLQALGVLDELEPKLSRPISMFVSDANLNVLSQVPFPQFGISGWRGSYTMYQPDLENALDRAVRALPQVEVLTNWEVEQITQEADHVVVESRHRGTGELRTSRGRYVIGADGANSAVRTLSGLAQDDLGYAGPWLVCDFEHHDPDVALPFRQGFVLDPARPTLVGRWLGRAHSRIEFMLVEGDRPEQFADPEHAWKLAARWGLSPTTSKLARHAVYEFGSMLTRNWRSGRVLLAGDAAHVMPPFLGQGLCSGIRDAANLTWKLDLVLRGDAGDALLDSYTEERRPHVEDTIRQSMALGSMVSITDPEQAAARDAALAGQGPPPNLPTPDLAGIVRLRDDAALPGAGALSLQSIIEINGRRGRFDDIAGHGWRILTRRNLTPGTLSERQTAVLKRLGAELVTITTSGAPGTAFDAELEYHEWFEELGAQAVIVRPDFYTYAVLSDVTELGAAIDDLAEALVLA